MNKIITRNYLLQLAVWSFYTLIVSLGCVAYWGYAFSGKVYKWTDENGIVQYGENPPIQTESIQELNLRVPATSHKEGIGKNQTQESIEKRLQTYDEFRRELRVKRRKQKETQKRHYEECARLRAELEGHKQRRAAIRYIQPGYGVGGFHIDEQRERRINELKDMIKNRCR